MRDRKADQQFSLPFLSPKNSDQGAVSYDDTVPPKNIFDLSSYRSDLHEQAVLKRVLREGYVKSKA